MSEFKSSDKWIQTGSNIYNKNLTGNVGIGTVSPNATGYNSDNIVVTVKGKSAPGTAQLELQAYGTIANNQSLGAITFLDGTGRNALIAGVRESGTGDGQLQFWTSPSGSAIAQRMVIDKSGNVGIGTTGPDNPLEVEKNQNGETTLHVDNTTDGTGAVSRLWLRASTVGGSLLTFAPSYTTSNQYVASSMVLEADTNASNGLSFSTINATAPIKFFTANGSEKVRILSSGNVGINITKPNSTLHVNGGQTVKRVSNTSTYTVTGSDYLIGLGSTAISRAITLPATANAGSAQIYIFKDEGGFSSTGSYVITASGNELIDGAANKTIATNYGTISIYNAGTAWFTF